MAKSVTGNPAGQSDAPHGRPSQSPKRRKARYLFFVVPAVLIVAGTAVAMPYVVDDSPEIANLAWPEMRQPQAATVLDQLDKSAPAPTPEGVAAALEPKLSDSALKGKLGASVYDVASGDELYNRDAAKPLAPASSTKVATAAAVLAARGADYRIPTRVVEGEQDGDVVLIAGGDVTLSEDGDGMYIGAASLTDLASQVTDALGDTDIKSLSVDMSLFEGEPVADGIEPEDLGVGYTAKLDPIMLNGGRLDPKQTGSGAKRYEHPGMSAAKVFGDKLGMSADQVSEGSAAKGAKELGVVYSPTIQSLVEQALLPSDNLLTDSLARQAALGSDKPASFDGGVDATLDLLKKMDVPTDGVTLKDGSGLSMDDEIPAQTLGSIMLQAASPDHGEVAGLFAALPVAAHSGSLDTRFKGDSASAAGKVRAKTGTLSKVSSLTGAVVDTDGRMLAFSVISNDHKDLLKAEDALDAVSTALYECGCK